MFDSARFKERLADRAPKFAWMQPWFPATMNSVLDIGCGSATIDVHIARAYPEAIINLLDGDTPMRSVGKNQVGYQNATIPWKDRTVGMAVVKHFAPDSVVVGHEPDRYLTIPADLIISQRSWGHHYPITEYIALVDRSLRRRGRIIVDLRFKTPGRAVLERHGYRLVAVIEGGSKKCERTVWERDLT